MKNRKSWVKFVSIFLLVLSPVFFIFIIELSLNLYHFYLPSKYTETFNETLSRTTSRNLNIDSSLIRELNENKIKIAVFGGSSAAGYASPHTLVSLMKNVAPEPAIIHKYAQPGSPFVGFQSERLKAVIKYYDVIIIYAGHNEIWSHIYRQGAKTNIDPVLPNGYIIDVKSAIKSSDRKLQQIKGLFENNRENSNIFIKLTNLIYFNSRISNLIRRSFNKFTPSLPNFGDGEDIRKKYPLYIDKPYLSLEDQKKFKEDFKKEINEISGLIRADQKLIISTVLANDFHPPMLDAVNFDSSVEKKSYENTLINLYDRIEKNDFSEMNYMIKDLKFGSNKIFIDSLICANKNSNLKQCLPIAENARLNDALPYRVSPLINNYIRSIKETDNIFVVDPEKKLNEINDINEYLSYFVDHSHPSSKGHALLASELLNVIFPLNKIKFISKDETCNSFNYLFGSNELPIKLKVYDHKHALKTNLHWLKNNINDFPINYVSRYYKYKAEQSLNECFN